MGDDTCLFTENHGIVDPDTTNISKAQAINDQRESDTISFPEGEFGCRDDTRSVDKN